jgi:hypothetical protein
MVAPPLLATPPKLLAPAKLLAPPTLNAPAILLAPPASLVPPVALMPAIAPVAVADEPPRLLVWPLRPAAPPTLCADGQSLNLTAHPGPAAQSPISHSSGSLDRESRGRVPQQKYRRTNLNRKVAIAQFPFLIQQSIVDQSSFCHCSIFGSA